MANIELLKNEPIIFHEFEIVDAYISPNPAVAGEKILISVAINEDTRILEPIFFRAGQIQAGQIRY